MRKIVSILLVAVALFAFVESQAGIVITNAQPCTYMVYLALAPIGTCNTGAINPNAIPVAVPPFSVTPIPCPPGVEVVGVCIQETAPFIVPAGGGCVGLAGPACIGFPLAVPAFGTCGMPVVFTPGLPAALNF